MRGKGPDTWEAGRYVIMPDHSRLFSAQGTR